MLRLGTIACMAYSTYICSGSGIHTTFMRVWPVSMTSMISRAYRLYRVYRAAKGTQVINSSLYVDWSVRYGWHAPLILLVNSMLTADRWSPSGQLEP